MKWHGKQVWAQKLRRAKPLNNSTLKALQTFEYDYAVNCWYVNVRVQAVTVCQCSKVLRYVIFEWSLFFLIWNLKLNDLLFYFDSFIGGICIWDSTWIPNFFSHLRSNDRTESYRKEFGWQCVEGMKDISGCCLSKILPMTLRWEVEFIMDNFFSLLSCWRAFIFVRHTTYSMLIYKHDRHSAEAATRYFL